MTERKYWAFLLKVFKTVSPETLYGTGNLRASINFPSEYNESRGERQTGIIGEGARGLVGFGNGVCWERGSGDRWANDAVM